MKQSTARDMPKPGHKAPKTELERMLEPTWKGRPGFRAQVLRLAATNFFPVLDEGVKELVNGLIRVSNGDLDRARRVIDQAIKAAANCPSPADLAYYDSQLPVEAPRGCELCEGTGMRYTKKRYDRKALDENGESYVYESYEADCQERCSCELGRFLKAREKEAVGAKA